MTLIIYWKLLIICKYFLDLNFCKQQTGSMISLSYSEEPSGSFCFCFSLHSLCCYHPDAFALSLRLALWGRLLNIIHVGMCFNACEWMRRSVLLTESQSTEGVNAPGRWADACGWLLTGGREDSSFWSHYFSSFFFFIPMPRGTHACLCKDKCLRLELQITWRPLSIVYSGGHTLYVTTSLEVRSVALCTSFPH